MAFPQTPLPVAVSIAPGADPSASVQTWESLGLWTDISNDVRVTEGISIQGGRQDEANQVDTTRMSLRLDNRLGKYSPRNPTGPYYGALKKNTPIKVEVVRANDGFQRTLASTWGTADNGMTWGDNAAANVTFSVSPATGGVLGLGVANTYYYNNATSAGGWNIDARMQFSVPAVPSGGTVLVTSMMRKRAGLTVADTYAMSASILIGTGGGVDLTIERWFGTGSRFILATQLDVVGTYTANRKIWVRSSCQGNNTYAKAWYDGGAEPTAWQLVFTETAPTIGFDPEDSATLLNVNAAIGALRQTGNTNVSSVNFYSYSTKIPLFIGNVTEWPVRWDQSANDSTVPITANGVIRRLSQGQAPLNSPLYRTLTAAGTYAYWPLEDQSGATSAQGLGTNVKPASVYQASFGWDGTPLGGAASTMTITQDTTITATLPKFSFVTTTGWQANVFVYTAALPPGGQPAKFFNVRTLGSKVSWSMLFQNDGSVGFQTLESDGTTGGIASGPTGVFAAGTWMLMCLRVKQVGADINVSIVSTNLSGDGTSTSTSYTLTTATAGIPISWSVYGSSTSFTTGSVGQVAFFPTASGPTGTTLFTPATGYAGETASQRVARLCTEQNMAVTLLGASTTLMGAQQPATFLGLLRQCENSDLGVLFESPYSSGLVYRPREARYNTGTRLLLNVSSGALSAAPEPTDDDQNVRNDWTVTRLNGSQARATDETHVAQFGRYDDSVEINVSQDVVLDDHASMRVYLGTQDLLRWPQISTSLARNTTFIPLAASMMVGSRLTVTNIPAQLVGETVDLMVEGFTYTLGPFTWDVEWNCSPAQLWTRFRPVATTGSVLATDPRVDSDTSTLNASITSTATSMVVLRPAGTPIWDSTAVPFDVGVGGERITVTAISGTGTTQTFTTTRSVNGVVKAQASGSVVSLWSPTYVAL